MNAFPYRLPALAFEEYIAAYTWYENKQTGLGERFIAAIDIYVERICANPEHYGKIKGPYRQVKIADFPYTLVYRFFPKRKVILIVAIHHTSRHPGTKFRKEQ